MNFYSLIGLLLALGVFIAGVVTSADNYLHFWDFPALLIVLGGTFAALSISFQVNRVFALFKAFFKRVLFGHRHSYDQVIQELMKISEGNRKGESLDLFINSTKDHFLKESLLLCHDNILEGDDLFEVLENRVENMHFHYMEEANRFKAAGKYPPAFGLMGTTIGMIVLLSSIGGADALKKIGPAMSVCLTATLYGVTLANFFFIPIGENLVDSSREIYLKNKIIVEGIRLMLQKTNPIVLAEKLNSFLMPHDRLDWKGNAGKSK